MWHKILYAFGSLGANALIQSYTLWLTFFYAPPESSGRPTLLPIVALGLIHGLSKVIELVDDPLIGFASDRTRSRLGRRVPYILLGAPVLVLSFFLLWTPPDAETTSLNAAYLFAMLLLFHLGFTVVMGPYDALLPELALSANARVNLASLKVVAGVAGAAVGLVGSGPLIDAVGFRGMAAAVAGIALTSYAVALVGIRGLPTTRAPSTMPLGPSLRAVLRNRPFLVLVVTLGLLFLGRDLLTQLIPYFTTVVLQAPEESASMLTGALITMVVLTLPVLAWLSRRWGTKRTASAFVLALGLYLPFLGLVGLGLPGVPLMTQGLFMMAMVGIPVAAVYVFPNALLADVVEYDALQTGHRREALYFGMFATLTKLAPSGSALILGVILEVFGFSAEHPLGIRIVPAVAGVCVLLGWAVFQLGYRLPEIISPAVVTPLSPGRAGDGELEPPSRQSTSRRARR
ncbi:MAG: hypothetical protein GEU73_15630 [Chloroflexi bacterium]|nr:hypothetical protein [Chloroflexota bacterium]